MTPIKLIIFDLDGVLVDAKGIHFEALNLALPQEFNISYEEHLSTYDGLKTYQKLEMLTEKKGLDKNLHSTIWEKKQKYTSEMLENLEVDIKLTSLMERLKKDGFNLAVCSNSIKETVEMVIKKKGLKEYFDLLLSNEDVSSSKPHPEMYWNAMTRFKVLPNETLIVEDSPYGLMAAFHSNANICRVSSPNDLDYEKIKGSIKAIDGKIINKWENKDMNVIIPMAGRGSRFADAGYTFPKPLIEVFGKPMIQTVVENLSIDGNYIFIAQKEHQEEYNLESMLKLITKDPKIVIVDGITEGAACTALLAKEYINNDKPLFFANSDQFVEWDSTEFFYRMDETNADGGIVTFKSTHPKWSFAKINEKGLVSEVAEKNPISDNATVGFYYWKKGSDFVKYAEQMIEKNIRVNNEFYVCPVFNEAINDGLNIRNYEINKMWGLGTPEDLDFYLKNFKS